MAIRDFSDRHFLFDLIRDYVYLNGEPVAMRVSGSWYWFICDHLDTPQKLVDDSGNVVWEAAYLPFGKARVLTAEVENNLRFPGQYFDEETGLHYNWNRYYDPELGRYITADPIGLDVGVNLYAYISNDPVNWIDPEGLNPYESHPEQCKDFCEDQQEEIGICIPIPLIRRSLCICKKRGKWKTSEEWAEYDHDRIRDRIRKEQKGFESGRHDQYPNAMRDELNDLADAADKRGDLSEYSKRLREIARKYDKRAKAGHRGGW